jgi:hypothetical protein
VCWTGLDPPRLGWFTLIVTPWADEYGTLPVSQLRRSTVEDAVSAP